MLWQCRQKIGETKEKRSETTKMWHCHPKPSEKQYERGADSRKHSGRESNKFLEPGWMKSERREGSRRVGREMAQDH